MGLIQLGFLMSSAPAYRYVTMLLESGRHGVFVVHGATPEWYRLVAEFVRPPSRDQVEA